MSLNIREITFEHIHEFNKYLTEKGSILCLRQNGNFVEIGIIDDIFLDNESQNINPTGEFYDILEHFFLKDGIRIKYNNTASTFWSVSYN